MVAAALAMLMTVVSTGTVPGETLVVTSVDATAYPEVVIDFVLPKRYSAVEITPGMVEVDGVPATAVVPVDPAGVVVSLVVDDGPAVPADVVGASQGGAIELVRNIDAGTRIAVRTPSGLQTAFTADPGATIARIAGITAGAPAVTPLAQLILDAAAALAAADSNDPHLVVVLGGPLEATDSQLSELADLVASNGISLHLVSVAGDAEPSLVLIAEQSGGSLPIPGESLASFDAITAAISNRFRIATTIDAPGEHRVALTIDGAPMEAVIAVGLPTPPAQATPAIPAIATSTTVGSGAAPNEAVASAAPTTVEVIVEGEAAVTVRSAESRSPLAFVAIVMMVALIGLVSAFLLFGRRRRPRISATRVGKVAPVPVVHAEPRTTVESMSEAEPDVQATPEPVAKLAPDDAPEPVSELAVEPVAEPVSEPVFEPVAELVSELVAERESELVSELVAELESELVADREAAELVAELVAVLVAELESRLVAEPVVELGSEPESERVPEPVLEQQPEPHTEPEAASQSKPRPKAKPRQRPRLRPKPQAKTMPMPETEPDPAADPKPADTPGPQPARMPRSSSGTVGRRRAARPLPEHRTQRRGERQEPARPDAQPNASPDWLVAGSLRFCPANGEVWSGRHRVHLSSSELGILELLMTGGRRGVTQEDIVRAGNLDPDSRDVASTLARLRRKTGVTGRGQTVRSERVLLYFLDDDVDNSEADRRVSGGAGKPRARR